MSMLRTLFTRASMTAPTALTGETTVCTLGGTPTSTITVRVRLAEDRRRCIGAKLEQPFIAELSEELVQFYKRKQFSVARRNLIRTFDGYAIDGVATAERSLDRATRHRLRTFSVVFTKFEGVGLRLGWGQGVGRATALACLGALGQPRDKTNVAVDGWEHTR